MRAIYLFVLFVVFPSIINSQIQVKPPNIEERKKPIAEFDEVVLRYGNNYINGCQDQRDYGHSAVSFSANGWNSWTFRNIKFAPPFKALEYGKFYAINNEHCQLFLKLSTDQSYIYRQALEVKNTYRKVYTFESDWRELDQRYHWQLCKEWDNPGTGPVYHGDEFFIRVFDKVGNEFNYLYQSSYTSQLTATNYRPWVGHKWTMEKRIKGRADYNPFFVKKPVLIKRMKKPGQQPKALGGGVQTGVSSMVGASRWIIEPTPGSKNEEYYIRSPHVAIPHLYPGRGYLRGVRMAMIPSVDSEPDIPSNPFNFDDEKNRKQQPPPDSIWTLYINGQNNLTSRANFLSQYDPYYAWKIIPSTLESHYYIKNSATDLYLTAPDRERRPHYIYDEIWLDSLPEYIEDQTNFLWYFEVIIE